MDTFFAGQFDIAVIGAGHAGIEAALAAARKRERDFLISSYASATASSVRRRASSQ